MTTQRITLPRRSATRLLPSIVPAVEAVAIRRRLEQQERNLRGLLKTPVRKKASKKDNVYDILSRLDKELDRSEER
jgi:hypothetical protein